MFGLLCVRLGAFLHSRAKHFTCFTLLTRIYGNSSLRNANSGTSYIASKYFSNSLLKCAHHVQQADQVHDSKTPFPPFLLYLALRAFHHLLCHQAHASSKHFVAHPFRKLYYTLFITEISDHVKQRADCTRRPLRILFRFFALLHLESIAHFAPLWQTSRYVSGVLSRAMTTSLQTPWIVLCFYATEINSGTILTYGIRIGHLRPGPRDHSG